MIDLYIQQRKSGYIVLANKRERNTKRSYYDETVFSFFINNKDNYCNLLGKVYESLYLYIEQRLLINKEDIYIRVLDKKILDVFSKSRKSLGKIKLILVNDINSYKEWKRVLERKGFIINLLMKNKNSINLIYDTLEDKITENVVKNINIKDLTLYPNIIKQLKINEDKRDLLRKVILRNIEQKTEKTVEIFNDIKAISIYSDGGISIRNNIETGHSYGSIIMAHDKKDYNIEFIKIKGKLDLLRYVSTKHNVDFMELYAAYRSLIIIKEKIIKKELSKGIDVTIWMDNKSNIDIFKGLRDSKSPINKLLWDEIYNLYPFMNIKMEWLKGHDINTMNNIADNLVNEGRLMDKECEVIVLNTIVKPREVKK